MILTARDLRRLALLSRGGHLEHRGALWLLIKGHHQRRIREASALLLLVLVLGADSDA